MRRPRKVHSTQWDAIHDTLGRAARHRWRATFRRRGGDGPHSFVEVMVVEANNERSRIGLGLPISLEDSILDDIREPRVEVH